MKHIPTAQEPEELKAAYKQAYGDSAYEYQHNDYEVLEFRLLSDAHEARFGEGISIFMTSERSEKELNATIRRCLETGVPYKYKLPGGAIA